ncbi:LysR family transcriptional regulator [Sphingomonas oryzagri]|uniref:LysR family transcriptional regulator n=1 Tax=Sphingomonas oryzagri TaxID=3042314 RepID=A0ABT6N2J9_9SPHN|nr:LysR family transcriptional regulator [Sphingomonas oryzagri]MDH7639266.1 LysR family transcriptional regulator [Sphingomonas oryzagri]
MVNPFDLNLRHLRALGSIVRLGSMRAAAEDAGLSQPALTQGLARLEERLGVVLFDRRHDGVAATEAGRVMADRASAAFERLHAATKAGGRGFSRPELLMTSTQLRAFLAVADHGGFASAAQATGMSAPSLHRAVRDLGEIGRHSLFASHGRGVQLTPAGHRLVRGVRLAATEISAGIGEVCGEQEAIDGVIVGAMPLARARVLPEAIAQFLNGRPRSSLRVVEGSWRELVEPLIDGVIDFMIGALREEIPPDLEQRMLLRDELIVVGRAGHPLAGKDPTIAELSGYEWVVPAVGAPLRSQWTALFDEVGHPPAPVECGSIMVIRGILAGTDLLTLLSPGQVSVEIESGLLSRIGKPVAHGVRTVGITCRRGWRPTSVQRRFMDCLEQVASEKIPENLSAAPVPIGR